MAQYEFSMQAACLKVMGKALHAMGKQTTEVHFHVTKDQMTLKGRAKDRVCYLEFAFQRSFFSTYSVPEDTERGAAKEKAMSMKYIMKIFKSLNDLEKIRLFTFSWEDDNADGLECIVEYNHLWTRTVKLPFVDERPLAGVKRFPSKDVFEILVGEFSSSLSSFQRSEQFISWVADDQEVSLRNHNGSGHLRITKTQTKIQKADFASFSLDRDVPPERREAGITFSLASVRRFIQFGESRLLKLVCDPGEINKPLLWTIDYENESVSARLFTSAVDTRSADDTATSVLRNVTAASRRNVTANQSKVSNQGSAAAQTPTANDGTLSSFLKRPQPSRTEVSRPRPSAPISQFSNASAPPPAAAESSSSSSTSVGGRVVSFVPPEEPPELPPTSPPPPPPAADDGSPKAKRIRFNLPETHTTDSPEPKNELLRQLRLFRDSRRAPKSLDVTERVFKASRKAPEAVLGETQAHFVDARTD